jgi:cysteine desulfurase
LIYFDSAASYRVLPEVQKALQEGFSELYGNSTASHLVGVAAHDEIEIARELLANKIGALKSEIVFTSGATESNNIAFKSMLLNTREFSIKKHIVTSEIEHKCVLSIVNFLKEVHGFTVTFVRPDLDGLIRKKSIEAAIQSDTCLVSIMHVNNELGTVNPIAEIGNLCFEKGILFHTDAAQSFCKVPIDVDDSNIDVMSISAHKIGGPKGVGAVYIRDLRKRALSPIIHGAGQEEGIRGGTVAAPLIKAFAVAIENFELYWQKMIALNLKSDLIRLLEETDVKFQINGLIDQSLPSIVSISFAEIEVGTLLRRTENSFALAQGSACSSKEIEPSHVLKSLGIGLESAKNTLRISFDHCNTNSDLHQLVNHLVENNYS